MADHAGHEPGDPAKARPGHPDHRRRGRPAPAPAAGRGRPEIRRLRRRWPPGRHRGLEAPHPVDRLSQLEDPRVTNTLIFVDLASEDPSAAGKFYADVFGWQNDARPEGQYHRMVPGGFFKKSDGTDSEIGNLHLGIFKAANARPHPEPEGAEPRHLSTDGRKPRIWVLIGDDDSADRILGKAQDLGATCCGATTTGPSSTATTTPSATRGATRSSYGARQVQPADPGRLHARVVARLRKPTGRPWSPGRHAA